MPESRGRTKGKRRGWTPPPPRRKPGRKTSPKWYGYAVIAVMAIGVIMIVGNYMGLLPGTKLPGIGAQPKGGYLWAGLGAIALGFLGATQWH